MRRGPRLLISLSAMVVLLLQPWSYVEGAVLREDIGELKIHDLLLRPTFLLREPGDGSFGIGESSFALRWELEKSFAGVIRIGPESLLNPLARYEAAVNDDVMLVEAFAELNSVYGRFRMGRLPVEFGYEGSLWERYLVFPRSLLFRSRTMMLRDVGGSYEIEHNSWYTTIVVHNGESRDDVDGRAWYTARWGYRREKFEVGLAGQTGSTKTEATLNSGDTLAGVDPTHEAKWRIGGLYTAVHNKGFDWTLEFYMGEREQDQDVGKFLAGHTDVGVDLTDLVSTHVRLDVFDPNSRVHGDLVRHLSAAVVLSNLTKSSNLILVGTKIFEEEHQFGNDELRLIWSLSPSGIVRF
ncbi:MAG: hypothetical protein AB7G93_03720 [Bdellovibrionales bacterium]